ncbi:type I-B CRISPR-associated endonuclease Cas1b [Rhodothermus marinus]|uniref:type I-B CRISPR-associated endonuclease Cas1b n=1 Tax=Rhodothermus marinus TaxID=29549 RepID=UPI0037C65BE3
MKRPYYIFSSGRLRRRQNTLFFEKAAGERVPDDQDETGEPSGTPTGERIPFPVEQVESLYFFGEVDLNSKLLTFLARHDIPAHFYDYYGNYTGTYIPRDYLHSGRLRIEQVLHYVRPKRRLYLARAIVEAATYNLLRVLRYYVNRLEGERREAVAEAITTIEQERTQLRSAEKIPELMGIEGRSREAYYSAWPSILADGPGEAFVFEKRERRPPSNEINALISFGNSLCYTTTIRQIHRTALDPTISYLHEPGARRFSLALDLSEIFKPILVDRAIFRLVKTGEITPRHFEERLGGVYLKEEGRRIFVRHWDERLRQTVYHRRLERHVSYERLIRLECYKLIRHLLDPKNEPYRGLHMWW